MPRHAKSPDRPWLATAAPQQASWRHACGRIHGRRRPNLLRSPAAPLSISSSAAVSSSSVRRRHVAIATERRFAVILIAGHRGTNHHRVYKGPGDQSSSGATSSDPPRATTASSRGGEGLLPRVRSVRSPPRSGRFRRHQCPSLSILPTKNSPSLSLLQPHAQLWSETTVAPNPLST